MIVMKKINVNNRKEIRHFLKSIKKAKAPLLFYMLLMYNVKTITKPLLLSKKLDLTYNAMLKYFKQMTEMGIVDKIKKGRITEYKLNRYGEQLIKKIINELR